MKPFYKEINDEAGVFAKARELKLALLLKGPTGCGKSRYVESMAALHNLELIKVSCNEDTSASDLMGRFLLKGQETVWQDGPVTRAVRQGALLYLDEIAEAREDVLVVIHSLTDFRREIYLDRINETVKATGSFMLIASFNPGYQSRCKELKPSTRQRFVTLDFNYPSESVESEIIVQETGVSLAIASKLAKFGAQVRSLTEISLKETVSTRLLIHAAQLIQSGLNPRRACDLSVIQCLTDDAESILALRDVVSLKF